MNRLSEIYDGWKNLTFKNKRVEEKAKQRMVICANCPMLTPRNICEYCGCYMPAKVRSMKSKCHLKKW